MNMISTGAFQAEMDASTKTETLAEKFARVWEKKNSKVARAGGVSLMALSLAACGSDDEEAVAADPVVEEPVVVVPDGVDQALTADEDTFVGVAGGDDTFTGTSATMTADDNIVDTSSTDSDTLNVTFTAAAPVMDVSGIENVNVNWDSLLVPTVDLDDVAGATVTLSTSRTGHNGDANVDNAGSNAVVFGAGFDDQVTVDGLDGGSVSASAADSVDVGTGAVADGTISVTADVATTVVVTGGDDVTVTAVAADDITIDGGDAEAVSLTVGVDAALTLTGNANTSATITSGAAEAVTLTIDSGNWTSGATAISGTVNLTGENADLSGETITGANIVTISDEMDTMDISSIGAAGFVFETVDSTGAVVLTVASGQDLTFEIDASGGTSLTVQTSAADDAAADSINMTLEAATANTIDVAGGAGDIETTNLTVDVTAATTIADIEAGTGTVNVTQADADVALTFTTIDASTLDLSASAGAVTATQQTAAVMSAVGAAGATTMVFAGTTHENTFESTNAEDDSVTFATSTGSATAVFAGGDNTVLADDVTTGTLSVTAGAGDDTINMDGLTTGHVTLALGDGDNLVAFGDDDNVAAGASITITTGTGDNTLNIEDATLAAGITITADLGTGTGTMNLLDHDLSLNSTITVTGLDVIAMGASTAAEVNATLLDGATLTVTGDGGAESLGVTMTNTAAATADFSNITISDTVGSNLDGLDVTGSAVADTITGTAGADEITGNAGDDDITGGAGNDTLIGSAGEDTYNIAFGGEGVDTITFVIADDAINFTGASDVVGTTVDADAMTLISGNAAAVISHGLTIIDGAENTATDAATYLTAAEVATFLTAQNITMAAATDVAYVIVEGTDGNAATGSSTLVQVTGGADLAIDTADVTLIAHFTNIESEDFTLANFSDFG